MSRTAWINVSVSSHYERPSYDSEVVTQGILGEQVELVEETPLFSLIRQVDGFTSWISTDQLGYQEGDGERVVVRSHFLPIYRDPDSGSEKIREAVIGSSLCQLGESGDWLRLALPDGERGWVARRGIGSFPAVSALAVVALAREFLGYQYFWGGRSPKGFDCSGFVQTVFGLHGIQLARDSWQQQQQHQISERWQDAEAGDLLFFSRTPGKVTHVAIGLGAGRFIHASGWVRYNSLVEGDRDYCRQRRDTFVSVSRYLK